MNHTVAEPDQLKKWRVFASWLGRRSSTLLYGSPERKRWHRWAVHIRFQKTHGDGVYALDPRYFTFKRTARRGRRRILETSGWAMQDSVIIAAGEKPYFMFVNHT